MSRILHQGLGLQLKDLDRQKGAFFKINKKKNYTKIEGRTNELTDEIKPLKNIESEQESYQEVLKHFVRVFTHSPEEMLTKSLPSNANGNFKIKLYRNYIWI